MKIILGMVVLMIAAPALARADFVHARGRVLFVDSDGVKKPFARVQVRLMDSDSDIDEEMARGFTDHEGRYSLSGSAGDSPCIGCGKPDPYVKVVLEDPGRVEVHDILHFTRNAVITGIREETSGEIDFGTRTFTEEYPEGMAAILYMHAQHAYDVFTKLSGDSKVPGNGGEVAIEIPVVLSFGSPYTTWDTIHWPGVLNKEQDFLSLDHEFGHRLRHAADGGVVHFNNDLTLYRYARFHKLDEDTNLGFAFNEGWAHYFQHMVQPSFLDGQWLGQKGDEVEGHVAHKLIAFSDSCGGFKPMWRALKNNPGDLHSFKEFFDAFIATRPTCSFDLGFNNPSPPKKVKIRKPLIADASLLANMRDDLKKQIDHIDDRSAAMPKRMSPRMPSSIRPQDRAVVERLWGKRLQSAESSDTRARATYRRLVTGLRPMTPQSIQNGTYERDARAARSAFILAVAQPRLREAQNIRRDIAAEKSKTADPALLSYLGRVDARYARLEEELKRALAVRNGPGVKPALGILPPSFAGSARSDN